MKNQTQTLNQAIAQANQDCTEQIAAMENSIVQLKKRFRGMREKLEELAAWMTPIDPPPTVIEPEFIIIDDDEEEAK